MQLNDSESILRLIFMPKYIVNILILLLFYSQSQAKEIAGFKADTWIPSKTDSSVEFMLTQDKRENSPRFYMRTTLDGSPEEVVQIIGAYENYAGTMPRMNLSQVHKRYVAPELTLSIGSQRKEVVTLVNAEVAIVTLQINIDLLPDFIYTLLLATTRDEVTGVIHVYWIQYNEKGFPNKADDLYGSWTLTPLEGNRTSVLYENYIDPGFWTRLFLQDTILQNNLTDIVKIIAVIRSQLSR